MGAGLIRAQSYIHQIWPPGRWISSFFVSAWSAGPRPQGCLGAAFRARPAQDAAGRAFGPCPPSCRRNARVGSGARTATRRPHDLQITRCCAFSSGTLCRRPQSSHTNEMDTTSPFQPDSRAPVPRNANDDTRPSPRRRRHAVFWTVAPSPEALSGSITPDAARWCDFAAFFSRAPALRAPTGARRMARKRGNR